MVTIANIYAREILDSRGNPTLEVEVILNDGSVGRFGVPAGASTGVHEAHELRDEEARYGGKGVRKAIATIMQTIRPACMGKTMDQKSLDDALCVLDGTQQKTKIGANVILGVSSAFARACAQQQKIPLYEYIRSCISEIHTYTLPVPMMNVLNGGAHAHQAIDIQEIMLVPAGAPSFSEALRCGAEIFHTLQIVLQEKGLLTGVGDEGGCAVQFSTNENALETLTHAVTRAGYRLGVDVFFALDVAASQLFHDGVYIIPRDNKTYTSSELVTWYESLITKYPIISIEDGCSEDDWDGWSLLTQRLGNRIQIVGDDLFVTNIERLKEGIQKQVANAIIIKPNQIGTISETIQTIQEAYAHHYIPIYSHRSGETEDTSIADMAVGCGVVQIKSGAPNRGERVAKYNQLLRIEEGLGTRAIFAGKQAFPHIAS